MEKNNNVRPPVVVVLGHVDHGKTTLLDSLRHTTVAAREFGAITQHIGAYELKTKEGKLITFIDTPGHEAFNSLRSRGAKVADLALLVVAANDSVKPQTQEAIKQIKANKTPLIVVINKIDLEAANVEKVFKDLAKQEIYVEGRGGETPVAQVSAAKKTGLDTLLELISLVGDLQNLTFDPNSPPQGVVIEAKKDRRGVVETIILNNGTLKVADTVNIGNRAVKVRALFNDRGESVSQVSPSTPVELLGSKEIVAPGSLLGQKVEPIGKVMKPAVGRGDLSAEDWFKGDQSKFNFIIKADTFGTLEAITEKFKQFEEIKIISAHPGELTETDLELAKTTKASVLLFNTKIRPQIQQKAEKEDISVFEFKLIYELLDQVEDLIFSLRIRQEKEARKVGEAKVIAKFNKADTVIAGLKVITGRINTKDKVEIGRGKKVLGETTISSLYQKSDPVPEVKRGEECGAIFATKIDFLQGDIVKLYTQ